jgi:hypothetical protein
MADGSRRSAGVLLPLDGQVIAEPQRLERLAPATWAGEEIQNPPAHSEHSELWAHGMGKDGQTRQISALPKQERPSERSESEEASRPRCAWD